MLISHCCNFSKINSNHIYVSLMFDGLVQKVRLWIEEILWEKKDGMDVYRCKGVLSIHNSNQLHTLQVLFNIKLCDCFS